MAWYDAGFGVMNRMGFREPAPRRLTLEELLDQLSTQSFQPSPRPESITSIGDLEEDERRRVQQDSLWSGLASIGALVSGDQRRGAAGIGELQDIQGRAIASGNARQEEAWRAENERRAGELQGQKRKQEASALFGMFEEVAEGESDDFVSRAASAAKAGSMAELEKMRQEKPGRAAARSKGYDPDAWGTTKRMQDELEAELEMARQKAALPGKLEEAKALAAAKNEAEMAGRVAQRDAGVLWEPPTPPAPREPSVPTTRQFGDGSTRQWNPGTGQWDMLTEPKQANAGGRWQVIPADPLNDRPAGRLNVDTGVSLPVEPPRSIDQRLSDIQNVVGAPLPPHVAEEARRDLASGRPPREIVAEILKDNPQFRQKRKR